MMGKQTSHLLGRGSDESSRHSTETPTRRDNPPDCQDQVLTWPTKRERRVETQGLLWMGPWAMGT